MGGKGMAIVERLNQGAMTLRSMVWLGSWFWRRRTGGRRGMNECWHGSEIERSEDFAIELHSS